MKKTHGFYLLLLTVLSVGVIVAGVRYQREKEEDLKETSIVSASSEAVKMNNEGSSTDKEGEKSVEERIADYETRLNELSAIEYLDYQMLKENQADVVFYGDFNGEERWLSLLEGRLNEEIDGEITYSYLSYADTDSYDLHRLQTTASFDEQPADLVIFKASPLADRIRDIGTAETNEFLSYVFEQIDDKTADARVVFLETHLLPEAEGIRNSRSLTYRSYAETMEEVANNQSVPIIESIRLMEEKIEAGEFSLSDLFQEDEVTLTETGHQLYATLMYEELKK